MDEESTMKIKKGIVIKIIVPVIILSVVACLWIIKNNKKAEIVESDKSGKITAVKPDFELHAKEKIDLEKLKSYGLPIIIDFGADQCIPCKEMAPILKELNEELQGKAIIKFVDVWKYREFSEGYPIKLIPTQIFFNADGKPYAPSDPQSMQLNYYSAKEGGEHAFTTHEGYIAKEQLLTMLKEMGLKE